MKRRGVVRDQRGVAMVEFALVLPVFLLIVAGLLAFGRVFFYWIETNHLANETARWAVVDRNPHPTGTLQENARDSATLEFSENARVCIDFPDPRAVGSRVHVSVEAPFTFVPILGIGDVTIRGESTMRIERFATGSSPTAYSEGCAT